MTFACKDLRGSVHRCQWPCRSSANKDVLQPFADEATVKAAGGHLFQDVQATQARAVISVACAISAPAGAAMTEGELEANLALMG